MWKIRKGLLFGYIGVVLATLLIDNSYQMIEFEEQEEKLHSKPRGREEINAGLNKERNGVYFLGEYDFDDFINYNDLALICFYETGDTEQILSEMLASVARQVQSQDQKLFEVAMVAIDRAPMLEARYHPVTSPDFRIYYKARNIKYYGR